MSRCPYDLKANSSYPKKFKANLKDILYTNSFNSMEEFFNRWRFPFFKYFIGKTLMTFDPLILFFLTWILFITYYCYVFVN
jgi:hypothetical protein